MPDKDFWKPRYYHDQFRSDIIYFPIDLLQGRKGSIPHECQPNVFYGGVEFNPFDQSPRIKIDFEWDGRLALVGGMNYQVILYR
jgi:hypothetical protein